ncbi:MAG TPA: urea ABC transporter substrate-binding protein [Herbaspirillum sp.]|jgi:urea transport system substrate-binding protein|nr:urea ABC transporter substrate-binding protein [Herbaspirillum sp.]
MKRRTFLSAVGSGLVAAAGTALPKVSFAAGSAEPIKLGLLFSQSGTMANGESLLKDIALMTIDQINAKGGVLGRPLQGVTVDPASDWPMYAQLSKQLILRDKCAALFGCWTSVSRKSVLPVVEAQDSLLFYPLHFEGEEQSKNVVYLNSPPSSSVLPAIDYLMSEQGGEAKRFYMIGSDYVWPRTINKMLKGYLKTKNISESAWRESYVPFGQTNFQTIVREIKEFAAQPGGQAIVVMSVVGDSIPALFKEAVNQGIRATDIPILGLDVVDSDLEGLDTKPLAGHLSCWCYFQNLDTPQNRQLKSDWKNYVAVNHLKHRPDIIIDPMVSTYLGIHLWAQAVEKAKSTGTDAVRKALAGQSMMDPAGYTVKMDASSQYLWRGDMIGSINANHGFDILWKSKDIVKPIPFSPFVGKA